MLKFPLTLTLTNFTTNTSKRYSGLTVDYGKYFEFIIDFCFDRGGSGNTEAMS